MMRWFPRHSRVQRNIISIEHTIEQFQQNIDTMERDRFDCVRLIAKQLLALENKKKNGKSCEMRQNDVSRKRFVFNFEQTCVNLKWMLTLTPCHILMCFALYYCVNRINVRVSFFFSGRRSPAISSFAMTIQSLYEVYRFVNYDHCYRTRSVGNNM